MTALHRAATSGSEAACQVLLRAGVVWRCLLLDTEEDKDLL